MVLVPFDRREALTVAEAAEIAGRSDETVRQWAARFDLGRRVARGPWLISKIALSAFLDGDAATLRLYLGGDRTSPSVVARYHRHNVPVPAAAASLDRSAA